MVVYIAEYGMGTDVSAYGDVYSFGILLLEMFTGKSPTDEMFKDNLNLREFSKMAFPDKLVETIDPILLQQEEAWDTIPSNATNHNHSHIGMSKKRHVRHQEKDAQSQEHSYGLRMLDSRENGDFDTERLHYLSSKE
ncbi:hypothetical protein LguiB_018355 [Lonicera macranthoides]